MLQKVSILLKRVTGSLTNNKEMFEAEAIIAERHLDTGHGLALKNIPLADIAPALIGKCVFVGIVSVWLSVLSRLLPVTDARHWR